MNTIKYIFTNPLGWGLAVVHWIVVAFAYLGDSPSEPLFDKTTGLMVYLSLLDFPALMLTKFLISFLDSSTFSTSLVWTLLVGLVTLQWLLIGAGFTKIYREHRRYVPVDGNNRVKFR